MHRPKKGQPPSGPSSGHPSVHHGVVERSVTVHAYPYTRNLRNHFTSDLSLPTPDARYGMHPPPPPITRSPTDNPNPTSHSSLAEGLFAAAPPSIVGPVPWSPPDEPEEMDWSFQTDRNEQRSSNAFNYLDELRRVVSPIPSQGSMSDGENDQDIDDLDSHSSAEAGGYRWSASPVVEKYPGAGKDFGEGRHLLQDVDLHDMYPRERRENVFYPFKSEEDFEMAGWLTESGASMQHIDKFLKLPMVRPLNYSIESTLIRKRIEDCAAQQALISNS